MKHTFVTFFAAFLAATSLAACGSHDSKTITVAASEIPHAQILNEAVKPLLQEKGYTLSVKVLDWTLQNDAVANGEYDANYFQHRPYLQTYTNNEDYAVVEPIVTVHFEPLHIYRGKSASGTAPTSSSTFEICNDVSNEIRALDLLKNAGLISGYDLDANGTPTNLPSNVTLIEESLLAASLQDYDFGVLPCNTALTANLTADPTLPGEDDTVADLRANVLAANTEKYKNNTEYKAKIDVLADALLTATVRDYITNTWHNVIAPYQKDLRN
jgi:D-methionine transport system substrate-binding protein